MSSNFMNLFYNMSVSLRIVYIINPVMIKVIYCTIVS